MISYQGSQVIDGLLLGDGGLRTNRVTPSFQMTQAEAHLDWLQIIQQIFHHDDILSRIYPIRYQRHQKAGWGLRSLSCSDLKPFRERFYSGSVKVVPADLQLTPASTLFWYIGDGSLTFGRGVCPQVNFATHCFTKGESEALGAKLKEASGVGYSVVASGKYYRLNLLGGWKGLSVFFAYINLPELIPRSYQYKFRDFLCLNLMRDYANRPKVDELFLRRPK